MISGVQIRAARAILRWSVPKLAEESGVTESVIRRIQGRDFHPLKRTTPKLLNKFQSIHDAFVRTGLIRFEDLNTVIYIDTQVRMAEQLKRLISVANNS